jgi:hypothetical protein
MGGGERAGWPFRVRVRQRVDYACAAMFGRKLKVSTGVFPAAGLGPGVGALADGWHEQRPVPTTSDEPWCPAAYARRRRQPVALKSAMPSGRGFLALNSSWIVGSRLATSPDSLLWSDDGRVAVKRPVLSLHGTSNRLGGAAFSHHPEAWVERSACRRL